MVGASVHCARYLWSIDVFSGGGSVNRGTTVLENVILYP